MTATANKGSLFLLRQPGESVVIRFGGRTMQIDVNSVNNRNVVSLSFIGDKDIRVDRLERLQLSGE